MANCQHEIVFVQVLLLCCRATSFRERVFNFINSSTMFHLSLLLHRSAIPDTELLNNATLSQVQFFAEPYKANAALYSQSKHQETLGQIVSVL